MTAVNRSDEPLLECDIVMAGGVTSGIIYPGAIAVISRRYRFRSIGGTSVGAIAAAVTAAAEYGRLSDANPQAFKLLSGLAKSLGESDGEGSRLLQMFTPERSTVPLFRLVSPIFRGGRKRDFARSFAHTLVDVGVGLPVLAAALASLILIVSLAVRGLWLSSAFSFFATASLVALVWAGALAVAMKRRWLPALYGNGFGICTGSASPSACVPDGQAFEGLTIWMNRIVQTAAGRGAEAPPLTFGNLWSVGTPTGPRDPTLTDAAPRAIELAMIASDISRNRTVQLPFIETPSPIYVDLDVLGRYFPPSVVAWIETHAGPYDDRVERRPRVVRLPPPEHLPIVFAARLSLSFPILLSAFPLLTPDFEAATDAAGKLTLRPLWLSDGGLTSNFPVHFFDSPIPARPTFCLNLIDFDTGLAKTPQDDPSPTGGNDGLPASPTTKPIEVAAADDRTARARPKERPDRDPKPGEAVWGLVDMVRDNRVRPASFAWRDDGAGAGSFLMTLVNTARFWSDNQMLMAPGIRDRVVNIALREDEGGLNLDMSPSMIADLDYRGRAAGLLISARFDPDAAIDPETGTFNAENFANHRWVRYRNSMAAIEGMARRFVVARQASDEAARSRREPVLEDLIYDRDNYRVGYKPSAKARPFYGEMTEAFEEFARKMVAATRSDSILAFDRQQTDRSAHRRQPTGGAPRPKMRFVLRPLADNDPRAEWASLPEPDPSASTTGPGDAERTVS